MTQAVEILIVVLLFCSIGLSAYTFHKVRRMHIMQYDLAVRFSESLDYTYQQLQALLALDRRLNLPYALPPLRGWAASPDFLLLIAEHAHRYQPQTIVECSSGSSTIVLAQCSKQNGSGHVFSLEHDAVYAEKTRQELAKQGLQDWATVIDAPLIDHVIGGKTYRWYTLSETIQAKNMDMLIIDGPPGMLNACARYPAGPLLMSRLNPGAAVFLDDADRPDERQIVKDWQSEFPNLRVAHHPCEKGAVSLLNATN